MAEGGWFPPGRRVTLRAIVTELSRDVFWRWHIREISLMTLITIRISEFVIPVHMTLLTWCRDVSAREREFCRRMVEGCRLPRSRRVARRTIMIELRKNMIRIF